MTEPTFNSASCQELWELFKEHLPSLQKHLMLRAFLPEVPHYLQAIDMDPGMRRSIAAIVVRLADPMRLDLEPDLGLEPSDLVFDPVFGVPLEISGVSGEGAIKVLPTVPDDKDLGGPPAYATLVRYDVGADGAVITNPEAPMEEERELYISDKDRAAMEEKEAENA